jgi:hypothetical protein
VIVEGYRRQGEPVGEFTTLGHPSLLWPSASEIATAAVTVFAGGRRPITLGLLTRTEWRAGGGLIIPEGGLYSHHARDVDYAVPYPHTAWYLVFAIGDQR